MGRLAEETRRILIGKADFRFNNLPGTVHEGDGSVGDAADLGGELGRSIEGCPWKTIENLVRAKRVQPFRIVQM